MASGGTITETGSALPVLLLNGLSSNRYFLKVIISNQVIIRLNNNAGATLQHTFRIPYLFDLKQGILTTDSTRLLTILAGGNIKSDSLNISSFINGPVKIEGLTSGYRLIPVGASNELRWVSLHNATGDLHS